MHFTIAKRGVTLMEVLVFTAVLAIVAGFSMRAIGHGRMIRANARDRITMAAIAQSELDRARLERPAMGMAQRTDAAWPSGTTATTTVSPGPDGTLALEVVVERESYEGKAPVRLATLMPSASAAIPATQPATAPSLGGAR